MELGKIIDVIGISLAFIGTLFFTLTQFIPKKEAIELGVSRFSGGTDEENLQLPMVKMFLKQAKNAKIGFGFVTIGFLLELISAFLYE
jgi:hypothetical protein